MYPTERNGSVLSKIEAYFGLDGSTWIPSLDGLRGIAIWMVLNTHILLIFLADHYYAGKGSLIDSTLNALQAGDIGVELFFVLSGFLIYRSIKSKKPGFFRFMSDRYRRLLPMLLIFAVALAVSMILAGFASNSMFWDKLETLINTITLLQIFNAPLPSIVMWTLVYEIYFYILAGFLLIVLDDKITRSWLGFFLVALMVWSSQFVLMQSPIPQTYRFMGFFFGMAVAKIVEARKKIPAENHLWLIGAAGISALLVYAGVIARDSGWQGDVMIRNIYFPLASMCFALVLISALNEKSVIHRILSYKPLRIAGLISYPIFLINLIVRDNVWSILYDKIGGFAQVIAVYLLTIIVSCIFSALLWKNIEFRLKPRKREGRAENRMAKAKSGFLNHTGQK